MSRVCWIGWTGPEMDEMASGVYCLDPNPHFIVLGSGSKHNLAKHHLPLHVRDYPLSLDDAFFAIECAKPDVLIYNDYAYSAGHRPEIKESFPGAGRITEDPRWGKLSAFKILHDGESFTQEAYYRGIAPRFDALMTYNEGALGFHKRSALLGPAVSEAFLDEPYRPKTRDVCFTGSCMNVGHRIEIAKAIEYFRPWSVFPGAYDGLGFPEYRALLMDSKYAICTFSCANGQLHPIHPKKKHLEAVLCYAFPVVEKEAGHLVPDWIPRVEFSGPEDLTRQLSWYLEQPDGWLGKNLTDAREQIIDENLYEHEYGRAFKRLGL